MTNPSVLWLGMLEGPSGYADETRGFLRALERAGEKPAARALLKGGDAPLGPDDRRMLDAQTNRRADGAAVVVHHYNPSWVPNGATAEGAANVARTMFETDSIPRAWLPQLLRRDEVWVPSEQGAEAFERGGIPSSRIRVVGGTLDFDLYRPGKEPLELRDVPEGHLVFLSNFEFTARKAWRELLMGWARAFAPTDPVCLVLKVAARGDGDGVIRSRVREAVLEAARAAGRTDAAPVRVMTGTLSTGDLARLYAAADAYVLPSRGEGWGRPYMEAMAMGVPTVASRFSGNLAFMDEEIGWLLDGELVDVPEDHGVFGDDVTGHRWFEPDVEHVAATLQEIAGDPAAAKAKAAKARPRLIERFGPEATTAVLRTAIAEVADRHARTTSRSVLVRGPFGRHQSLGLVNDRLLERLERDGRRVLARPPHNPVEVRSAVSISHHWPPDFGAATLGPAALILPWEYGSPPAEWVERTAREADRVIVPSRYVKDCYVAGGMPPGVVEVVPNGVDLDLFSPDGPRRRIGGDFDGTTFLFVGGTLWRKGIDLLLTAWLRAFGPGDDVRLVVKDHGGDSHYRNQNASAEVRAFAARGDVAPVIHLTDHLQPHELPALYRAADVLVHPYRGEGFGLPILEAMACGVPVVHTAIGPSSEFTGPDAGWAVDATRVGVPPNSDLPALSGPAYTHEPRLDALAAALREAAASSREELARRGAAAREQATAFSWDRAAADLEQVLATLEREALPPIRDVVPERPAGRTTLVAYAPDWDDEPTWRRAIEAFTEAFGEADDVTLALCVSEARAGDVAERVTALLDGRADLPDLALHQRPDDDPLPLVAGADAVLLDDAQTTAPEPRLTRRAKKVVAVRDLKRDAALTTTEA